MTVCGIKHADGVCVMGECPYIKMCCPAVWDKSGKVEMTNEQWIKSANTEELADVLNKIFMTRTFCHICPEGDVCDLGYECKYHGGKICDFMKWLKATHRG